MRDGYLNNLKSKTILDYENSNEHFKNVSTGTGINSGIVSSTIPNWATSKNYFQTYIGGVECTVNLTGSNMNVHLVGSK